MAFLRWDADYADDAENADEILKISASKSARLD
jgi:hypothetical protein